MISQLGRYQIIGELGHGAMGIVYKAKDPLIDRILAIKTINLKLALDEKAEYEARFYQEAKAAGRLSHPNILTVYDVGQSGEVAYIAMEFLQGRELRDMLNDGQQLPIEQVLDIVIQVAQGLAYAHEHGIVHRDVKPSNIMVTHEGHVKITDFGIARMSSSSVKTQAGVVLGSPKYMSPEQVLGKSIDQRSDIFSLGVMMYEMLTEQAPFTGESINAVMYQTMNAVPPLPSTINLAVPAMLNFIVSKALAKSLEDRYQSAKELATDLRSCRDSLPRANVQTELTKAQSASPISVKAEGSSKAPQSEINTEELKPVAKMGLSSNFDSFDATMRLAAITAPEDVEEIGNTLRMTRPNLNTLSPVAPVALKQKAGVTPKAIVPIVTPRPVPVQGNNAGSSSSPRPPSNRYLFFIMLLLLVLLGLVYVV
jgi:serine/threonine-protein kinase